MTLSLLQEYWWLLISVLGAILVFMLFVQGGQTYLLGVSGNTSDMGRMISSLGHKWELTFTTLVVFGGAFFASFPLFYSTSFGGAYWLWILILISFVLQAVSYEFRSKSGNLFGTRTYDTFLFLNGAVGCILLGVAVGMMFFGAEFTVDMGNILDHGSPVISRWAPTHGLEAILCWKNLLLGVTVLMLARTLASLYMLNDIADEAFGARLRRQATINGALFVVLFLAFLAVLLTQRGLTQTGPDTFQWTEYKYLHNAIDLWPATIAFAAGVAAVLWGIGATAYRKAWRGGIWWAGAGTILVVISLFCYAGFNSTAYYPSLLDTSSSLSIRNSSSTEFTLTVMSWVSVIVPFVAAYIIVAWRKMDSVKVTATDSAH